MSLLNSAFVFALFITLSCCNKVPVVSSSSSLPEEIPDSMSSHQSMYYWPKQYSHQHPVQSIDAYEHTEMIPSISTQKFSRKSSSLTPSMLMFSTVPSLAVSVLTFPMTLTLLLQILKQLITVQNSLALQAAQNSHGHGDHGHDDHGGHGDEHHARVMNTTNKSTVSK